MNNGQGPQGGGPSSQYASGAGDPDPAHGLRQAFLLHQQGRLEEANALYREILAGHPNNAHALHLFGVLRAQRGDYAAAADFIGRAVALDPNNPTAFYNLGNTLRDLNRLDEALASYDRALALRPNVETWGNRGSVLQELGRPDEAIVSFDRALAMNPLHATSLFNRANALGNLRRYADALAGYDRVLALKPDHAAALNGRGIMLQELRRFEEAFAAHDKAFRFDPSLPYVEGQRLHTKRHACDWPNLADETARLERHIDEGKLVAMPFVLIGASDSEARQLAAAEIYVRDKYAAGVSWRRQRTQNAHDKIRVGYMCGELREHATAYLTAGLFECHDRNSFEIHAISTNPSDGSAMRKRLDAAFDVFTEVSGRVDGDIADVIRRAEIDILVNLNGYFGDDRTGVFAARPAPLQVSYLGYPATMGAPFIDYIIADNTVIPDGHQKHYAEKIVYLPNSYQPNDGPRTTRRTATRAECGLSRAGFVFCCFNNQYKLGPEIFGLWMRLLAQIPGSVLWLLEWNGSVRRRLLDEAKQRDIGEDRIVFAPLMKFQEHLSRVHLGDLFLDTIPCNAHTTASDALWCGVPVLTCLGSTFAGRVAASLLKAVGLDELITHSLEEYEALALTLARNPEQLAALKARLAENRNKAPLFDTPRYTRNLEAAYRTMWERQQRDEPPASFLIEDGADGR